MDPDVNDLKPSSWYAQILTEVADMLLDSSDISEALIQAQTDASVLRNLVIDNFDDIMSSSTTPLLEFVERPEWRLGFPPRFMRYGVLLLICLLGTSIGLIEIATLADIIAGFFFLAISLAIIIAAGIVLTNVRVIEPVGTTREVLAREVVGPFLREQINRILSAREHSDTMRITAAPGLADFSEREQLIVTDTIRETHQLATSMSSGSIGVSGPRGVGKTTLMRYFCDPLLGASISETGGFQGFSDLRIFISAPIEFDTKDFVLHLFRKLCQTVIDAERTLSQRSSSIRKSRGSVHARRLVAASILIVCGIGLIGYAILTPRYIPRLTKFEIYLSVGILCLIAGIIIFARWTTFRSTKASSKRTLPLVDEARAWLTRIGYMQTLTSGYAASMKIPAGMSLEFSSGRQLSELEFTLPDLIDQFKLFAERAIRYRRTIGNPFRASRESQEQFVRMMEMYAALLHAVSKSLERMALFNRLVDPITKLEAFIRKKITTARQLTTIVPRRYEFDYGPKIMIGIDEVDKIDTDSAQRFLNEIKAIFGVPNCLYMVSVSDETLAVFEQRVLLGRTAFDNAFDEVVRARELDFESCQYLLRRRVAGMPDSLMAFCQVMSGGLPRDLIRMARSVVEVAASGKERIEDLTLSIVNDQIEILRRMFITGMTDVTYDPSPTRFPESLVQDDWIGTSAQSILDLLKGTMGVSIHRPVSAALYFYATVAEVFSSKTSNSRCFLSGYLLVNTDWIDSLARARNMLSTNSDIAWELISRFRITCSMAFIARPEAQF